MDGRCDLYSAFPDLHFTVTDAYHTPGTSILEVTGSGTHLGEFSGIPASGHPVRMEACAIFRFGDGVDAGKLTFERAYLDIETVLRQCRGEAGPTGIGLAP